MFCRHPRLLTLPRDLFEGLATFRELERRIVALPEELQRGDALEVFVEAYLQTHPLFQVDQLWLVGQVPREVRKSLNLPSGQKSIDGVFKTRSGELVPYQVKFRTGRPQVTVTEVSTFLGLTERAKDRMLISNSERYAGDIENRDHLRILTGTYFDSLACDELAAIADWLKGRPARPAPATPRPHQHKAIKDITTALATEDRTTAVMACGTGKTLVGLRVAEAIAPRTVLVLVPSLALLSQVLADWCRDTAWGDRLEYLCVCSDPSVSREADAWGLRCSEAPFPVQTDPEVVRTFLSKGSPAGVRVVLCTYQSASVVAEGLPQHMAFDLGVFDEAHKTTGPSSGTFAFALDDSRLPIRKRLFLTATPTKVEIRHRNREGEFQTISMDDHATYGCRSYELSFAEAVSQGIICDYQVVASTVDSQEISDFAIRHGITLVKGDQHATKWVATQIAVEKAIRMTKAEKVITFHSRVQHAKDFASDTPRGIGQYLPDFAVCHVSGDDPMSVRKETLAGFGDNHKRLVTNARCLTEGVDLPAADMVVFSNPRKSRVDIIQAVGRAMRKPNGSNKTLGYVVVPILLHPERSADLETACHKTDWEDIVDVLAALRSHDRRLDDLIRQARMAVGEGRCFSPRYFKGRLRILSPSVTLDRIQQHVAAVLVQRLGQMWDLRYGELKSFRDRHGHCNIPYGDPEIAALRAWMVKQRTDKRVGKLSAERITLLDALGVVWDPRESDWEEQFAALQAIAARGGDCNIPQKLSENRSLGSWLNLQRVLKRKKLLPPVRASRLESLGVLWDPCDARWEKMYALVADYARREGHCNVPTESAALSELARWLRSQRGSKQRGRLTESQITRLEAIGVTWDLLDDRWDKQYAKLKAYKQLTGKCDYPVHDGTDDPVLGSWLQTQRKCKRDNKLSADRVARLEALGITWEPRLDGWDERFAELEAFKKQQGHCNLTAQSNASLAAWLTAQRGAKRSGTLPADRVTRMESLGIDWDPRDAVWEEQFVALVRWSQANGNCDVPRQKGAYTPLCRWLAHQRAMKRAGTLSPERATRLEILGVVWDPEEAGWESRFLELVVFRSEHGHCNVPQQFPRNPQLGWWLNDCRMSRKEGSLSQERIDRLESLGVIWSPKDETWNRRFAELEEYRSQNGHCNVPQKYPPNLALGAWVSGQRAKFGKGSLSEEQIARLQSLGLLCEKTVRKVP